MKVLVISGTLVGSKTLVATEYLLKQLKRQSPEMEIELVNLKEFKLDFCDGRQLEKYNGDTRLVIKQIENADGYVLGTTILHGSIPGALKNLFDLIPFPALEGKPIALVANGGNPEHSQAIEKHLRPMLHYLKMKLLPHDVFLTSSDFNEENEIHQPERQEQLMLLARDFKELCNQTLIEQN
ncbi:hypothetical protein WQ57_16745 [Mesobacillus campisalis]|uniref:NADPH-dependent FMN reductase-like domain-containing protein n=1 Tax=Mesobacillus campisalis TaxID=1408103 RepID=A0A0M2SW85_9BACI|nr:NAD(P)H-dependent oxidoreductase [Mesobacillus campisalis]KKK36890.1 hypothetical protein WQ57_16745 [Mesobacillus campisalis]